MAVSGGTLSAPSDTGPAATDPANAPSNMTKPYRAAAVLRQADSLPDVVVESVVEFLGKPRALLHRGALGGELATPTVEAEVE